MFQSIFVYEIPFRYGTNDYYDITFQNVNIDEFDK